MKKLSIFSVFNLLVVLLFAQATVTPQSQYGRVYTMLNTKCQNATCHSATSTGDNLKFDGDSDAVYQQIFNRPSALFTSSVSKYEKLVKPQHPYTSFLLRKIAGAQFDTDLALDSTGEGALMNPIPGDTLSKAEIEFVRQWIRFGAKETYAAGDAQPDYSVIYQYYNDTAIIPFFPKPPAPAAGRGFRFRMGPVFLPVSGAFQEQEWLEQQEVNFPYLAEVTRISGYMNNQSHHFLLFKYTDSTAATSTSNSGNNLAPDIQNMAQITPSPSGLGVLGTTSFDGDKNLTGAWQENADLTLPAGTALMWEEKTYLDMNFHVKNYNATTVLPCDFYFNVYFEPRNAQTLPMISELVNNGTNLGEELFCPVIPPKTLPQNAPWRQNFNDGANGGGGMRYLWMIAGHTHKFGTGYWVVVQDTSGAQTDTIYDGQYDYANQAPTGFWDHTHPPLEYFSTLKPVYFGKNAAHTVSGGLVANTSWYSTDNCVHFGFTTADEMQLFYYMYTTRLPGSTTAVNDLETNPFSLTVVPNPVSGGNGKLVYILDENSKVSSEIFDVTGKVISKLDEETEVVGAHQLSINSDQRIASGVYFARLTVNGVPFTKKFVVTE